MTNDKWQRGVAQREPKSAAQAKPAKPPKLKPSTASKALAFPPKQAEIAMAESVEEPSPVASGHPTNIESIDVVEHYGFNVGTAMNLLWNSNEGDPIDGLQKAEWHIRREIERRQRMITVDA